VIIGYAEFLQERLDPENSLRESVNEIVKAGNRAASLNRRRPNIKAVFMSGHTGQTIGEQGPIDPGSAFVAKPFTQESLTRRVREALDRHVPVEAR